VNELNELNEPNEVATEKRGRQPGRPRKVPPGVDVEMARRVKRMAKDYGDAKMRVRYYEKIRRSLLERAGVDLPLCEQNGTVVYDGEEVQNFPAKDKAAVNQYLTDKQTVLWVEKGVASIAGIPTREIAQKTILEGKRCEEISSETGIPRATVFREKGRALQWIAFYIACREQGKNK